MNQGFDVQSQALRTYARETGLDAGRIDKIRREIGQLELPAAVFGTLPEADNLKTDYDEKLETAQRDLKGAADLLRDIVEAVQDSAESYEASEEATTLGFQGQGG